MEPVQPVQPVDTTYPSRPVSPSEASNWRTWRAANFVYVIFGIVEALILIRFVLKLLAANPDAGFSSFMYNVTAPMVAPFQGVFPTPASNGSVLEIASLLAIVVYALISWAIVRLIELAQRPTATA